MNEPFIIFLKERTDDRGSLSFTDGMGPLPFEVKRVYWLWDIPENEVRGGHAHKTSEQVIICTSGKILVSMESKEGRHLEFILDNPTQALYLPPLWWGEMEFLNNATMIGLASDEFSEDDYIRNRADF